MIQFFQSVVQADDDVVTSCGLASGKHDTDAERLGSPGIFGALRSKNRLLMGVGKKRSDIFWRFCRNFAGKTHTGEILKDLRFFRWDPLPQFFQIHVNTQEG